MEEGYGFKPEFLPSAPDPYPNSPPNSPYPSLAQPNFPFPSGNRDNQAYRWIASSTSYGSVPPRAIQGGMDSDGHPIFVGRAYHEGDLLPAKIIPGKNAAYVAYNGEELLVHDYQVLCRQEFEWVPTHGGNVPPGAIQGGHTSSGETLYVGRAYHEGSQTVGKVHPSHGCCYIPFGGEEVACPEYETLVLRL